MRARSAGARTLLVATRTAWGTLLTLAPDRVLVKPAPDYVRAGVRVLGARHLVEGAVLTRHARRPPPQWSIAVDALHALSMFALAVARPGLRPVALRSATSALTLAALSAYER